MADRDSESVRSHVNAHDMRLDPLTIPIFDGKIENWLVFRDMFESLVHKRADLDSTYKLGKLRQYVKADAVPMIANVYTGGYEQVWGELKRRFDQPRYLVKAHVDRLLDLPERPQQTCRSLQAVVDCVRDTMRALTVMDLPVDQWDGILYVIILRKLPEDTFGEWSRTLRDASLPKLESMLEFIENHAMTLPSSASSSTTTPSRRNENNQSFKRTGSHRAIKAHVAGTTTPQRQSNGPAAGTPPTVTCPYCSESHRIGRCLRFKNESIEQRRKTAANLMLCFNCLSRGHSQRDCRGGNCMICQQRHHTMLCQSPEATATASAPPTSHPSAHFAGVNAPPPSPATGATSQSHSRQQ